MRCSETWTAGQCHIHGEWGVKVERLGSGDEPKVADECPRCRMARLVERHEVLIEEAHETGFELGKVDQDLDAPSPE